MFCSPPSEGSQAFFLDSVFSLYCIHNFYQKDAGRGSTPARHSFLLFGYTCGVPNLCRPTPSGSPHRSPGIFENSIMVTFCILMQNSRDFAYFVRLKAVRFWRYLEIYDKINLYINKKRRFCKFKYNLLTFSGLYAILFKT